MEHDKINYNLDCALRIAGIQTDSYTRDLFMEMIDLVREKGDQVTLHCISDIEVDLCERHGLDIKTKRPIRHDDRKIFITKVIDGVFMYMDKNREFTIDAKEAHDYKTADFAEQMIIAHKHNGVMITQHL